jgi:hypothetical protein
MTRIIAALGLAGLVAVSVQTGAQAVPRDPTPTCVRDYRPVPCVKRTWHPPVSTAPRTWRGTPFDPRTR